MKRGKDSRGKGGGGPGRLLLGKGGESLEDAEEGVMAEGLVIERGQGNGRKGILHSFF